MIHLADLTWWAKALLSSFHSKIRVYLLCQLASGEVFGPDQPIALKLLGSERSIQALEGKLPAFGKFWYLFLIESGNNSYSSMYDKKR